MKLTFKQVNSVAVWKWHIPSDDEGRPDPLDLPPERREEEDEDVCGICRVAYDGCCPDCKLPGDDCPLIWGQCTHVFHMHCLIKWINQDPQKQQCPMDRRPWVTASGEAVAAAQATA